MGLLTGVSILSAVEIFYFVAKALISLSRKLTGKLKEKQSKVRAREEKEKKNSNDKDQTLYVEDMEVYEENIIGDQKL